MELLSAEQAKARDDARTSYPDVHLSPLVTSLAADVNRCWQDAKQAKQPIELRITDCLQRRNGEYPADKLAAIRKLGGCETYLKHTGVKCRAATAWIRDVLLSTADRPWGIQPTPVPDMPPDVVEGIVQMVMQDAVAEAMQTGVMPPPEKSYQQASILRAGINEQLEQEAKRRAAAMEAVIADQFIQGGFSQALHEVIDDIVTVPAGIMKGPVVRMLRSLAYDKKGMPTVTESPQPTDRRVSPWDIFPSPDSSGVDDGYIIERMRLTRRELVELRDSGSGFVKDNIDAVLRQSQGGLVSPLAIDSTRQQLEGKQVTVPNVTGADRIEVIEYWGPIQGQKLIDFGMESSMITDPWNDYEVCVVMALNPQVVLKAMVNPDPLGRRPYYVTSYELVPGSFWGRSLVELMAPVQDAMNAVLRSMIDNVAFASGPQVTIDLSMLDKSQHGHADKIWPRKVHLVKGGAMGSRAPVDFFQPTIVVDPLIRMLAKLEQLADDHSGVPAYSYGNQDVGGAGQTLGGLNMLMQSASKGIRQVIAFIGLDIIVKRVERQFTYVMLYHPDHTIKGDCRVNARGALAEVIRDQLKAQRQDFVRTMMPPGTVAQAIGPQGLSQIIKTYLSDMELDSNAPGVAEMQSRLATVMMPQPQAPGGASAAPGSPAPGLVAGPPAPAMIPQEASQ